MTLTRRQREVLILVAHGCSTRQIAAVMQVSVKGVEYHRHQITRRLGTSKVALWARYAVAKGWVRA